MSNSENFDVPTCKERGCLNFYRDECSLDRLPIGRYVTPLQNFLTADICLVRKQINMYKTNKLLNES